MSALICRLNPAARSLKLRVPSTDEAVFIGTSALFLLALCCA